HPATDAGMGSASPAALRARDPLRLPGPALPAGRVPGCVDGARPAVQLDAHRRAAQLRRALDDRPKALGEPRQPGAQREPRAVGDGLGDAATAPPGPVRGRRAARARAGEARLGGAPMRDATKFGAETTASEVADGIDLHGKVALVTGGSSGLGRE